LSTDRRRVVPRRIWSRAPTGNADGHAVAPDLAARRTLVGLSAGLLTLECGQLIRTRDEILALLHVVIIGVVTVGVILLYRDVRRARRRFR
jgi:hypothetical protein